MSQQRHYTDEHYQRALLEDRAEEQHGHVYCDVCETSPCRWDGLIPDGNHAPHPREHDHDCGRHEERVVVISPQRGAWILTLGLDEARGHTCYVCRRSFEHNRDLVRTNLQVDTIVDTRVDVRDHGFYLHRHPDCAWPTWPACGCPYEYIDGSHQ